MLPTKPEKEIALFDPEFLLTSLIVILIPGTGVIYTVSTGLFFGWRSSIAAAIGCTAGILPHLTACILGLSAILHMSSVAFQCVKLAGVLYLFYLAWSMWHETGALKLNPNSVKYGFFKIMLKGFLVNILNPKLSIFFLAFLPLFVSSGEASTMLIMIRLSLVFMVMTLITFIIYGLVANGISKHVTGSPALVRWLQRSFAATFAAIGARLAMADQ
ncbi:LysE family translocator [Desulfobotulus sp. H1]|uniref:LysE family translocator n=1 Tax=Desulfobotulus pelophilus TaxID=2823377 RepID=A0ABT3NA81_9BACT|nr:LysE family translocator [Desulfobotulus pelophilus]MCW7754372.1 LysE family translocator [Desulfobotulus pelophilus]